MKIHLESGLGQNLIRAYVPGRITINEEVYATSLIVTLVRSSRSGRRPALPICWRGTLR